MRMKPLSRELLLQALGELDRRLPSSLDLLVGGGSAMVAAYAETQATHDLDALPIRSKLSMAELQPIFIAVAEKFDLPKDWVNAHFGTFTHVLPADYRSRLREIFKGSKLSCQALGPEDLLVMKLAANRQKDERHIRRLLRRNDIHLGFVEKHLESLVTQGFPGAQAALDRLDELKSLLDLE